MADQRTNEDQIDTTNEADDLDLLTPEERAGMEDEDLVDATDDAGKAAEKSDDDHDEDDDDEDDGGNGDEEEDDDEGDDDQDEGQGQQDEGTPKDGEEEEGQPDTEDDADVRFRPQIIQPPADAEERMRDIERRENELAEKFDEGDITSKEFQAQNRALATEREALNWEIRKAELSQQQAQEFEANAWQADVRAFLKDHPEIRKNELMWTSFDLAVRKITGSEEFQNLSNRKQLEKAHQVWADQLGLSSTQADNRDKPQGKSGAKPVKQKREIPPTLARVPAADVQDTDDGKYGLINRLYESSNPHDVAKAEDMLAKMSPEEQDRYLASR